MSVIDDVRAAEQAAKETVETAEQRATERVAAARNAQRERLEKVKQELSAAEAAALKDNAAVLQERCAALVQAGEQEATDVTAQFTKHAAKLRDLVKSELAHSPLQ